MLAAAATTTATGSPSPSRETSDSETESAFRIRSPYLHIAPVGIGSLGDPAVFWGLGAGIMLPRRRRGVLTIGGFAEYVLVLSARNFPEDRRTQLLRFGPELRIGGGRRLFVYGHARLGLELLILDGRPEAGVMATLGGGLQGLLTKRLLIGTEIGADVLFFGVNGFGLIPRLRVFTGFKF